MTTEQVPLAEQITILTQLIADASAGYLIQPPELHQDEIVALRAVLATLQQHERAMAVIEALIESRRLAVKARQYNAPSSDVAAFLLAEEALNDALAALDDAASAAATPAGKGETADG